MPLRHAEDIQRVEARRKALDHIPRFVLKQQNAAPIGRPARREVEHIGVESGGFGVSVMMRVQKMAGAIAGDVGVAIDRRGIVGEPAHEGEKGFAIEEVVNGLDRRQLVADMRTRKPNDPVPAAMAGMLEVAQSHLPEAEAAYKAVIKKFPDFAHAKVELAYVYRAMDRRDDAKNLYKEILAKTPGDLEALQDYAVLLEAEKQHDAVVDLWQKARRAKPDNLPAVTGLVRALVAKRDLDGALALVRDTQLRLPNEPQLYEMRGGLELTGKKPEEAVVSYRRLSDMQPQSAAALRQLAVALDQAGDIAGAVTAIGNARKIEPTNLALAADEIKLAGKRDPSEGIAAAQKISAQFPDEPAAQIMEGDYLTVLKRPGDAKDAYQRAFAAHPSLALVEKLASVSVREGRAADGLTLLTEWASAHPDDVGAKFDLANFYAAQKNVTEAKKQYEAVITARPDHVPSLNELALIYHRDGDARALDYAKRAYAAAPGSPIVTDTVGWIMVRQGDVPNGLKLLARARDGAPEDPSIQYHVAYTLERTGKKSEAVEILKKAIASGKRFDEKADAELLLANLSKG